MSSIKIADSANKGEELELVHPVTREPYDPVFDEKGKAIGSDLEKPWNAYVKVLGTDSAEYRRRSRAWLEKCRTKSFKKITLADGDNNAMEDRIACVVEWKGIQLHGKDLEFTPENVRKILTDPNFRWLCEQIDDFMFDRANFIKSNGKS